MGALSLQAERFADVIDEAMPLLLAHWTEVAHYQDRPLAVDRAKYQQADEEGFLRIYTARMGGKLAGYAAYFVGVNPHYSTSAREAKQDVLYLQPSFRGLMLGVRLVRFADTLLAAEGVAVVYQHQKLAHPALGAVLRRAGYEPIETVWGRRLDIPTRREGEQQPGAAALVHAGG